MYSSHRAREGPAEGTIGPAAEPEEAGIPVVNQRPARAANAGSSVKSSLGPKGNRAIESVTGADPVDEGTNGQEL